MIYIPNQPRVNTMKHFVKITSKMGSKHFPIELDSSGLYAFNNASCEAVDALAWSLGIKHIEMLRLAIEYSINEGDSTQEQFRADQGDIADFSYELLSCAESYSAYKDCGVWYVDYLNKDSVVWTETYETKNELRTVYKTMIDLGLFEFA